MTNPPLRILTHLPKGLLARVERELPGAELVEVPERGPIAEGVVGEILLTQAWGSPNLAEVVARGVRWVHTFGTGVDAFPFEALGDRPLTCSRGASAVPIAEWVMAMLLAAEKDLPDSWLHEPPEHWNYRKLGGLRDRTLALLGLGGIGCAVAERALPFGMHVRALRRTNAPSPVPGVELARDLDDLLATADHLVIAAPATRRTRRLLDARAFERIKPGAHVINVARGGVIDQVALKAALDGDRLSRASLDTVEPEPLPAEHWLYTHPRVRLSAHVSWSAPGALDELLEPFVVNLHRYLAGEALEGAVDLDEGY